MADDLKTLRDKLRTIVNAAWNVEGAKEFRTSLEGVFPAAARDEYMDCIDGPTPRDCLRKVAKDHGLRELYESAWDGAPEDLVKKLAGVKAAWTSAMRDKLVTVFDKLDIPELYSLCMAGDFSDVVTKAGLDTEPGSFRECATAVAKVKKLRKELRTAWGKK